jgi:hypothetical protein
MFMEQDQKARTDAAWQLFCILVSIVIFSLVLANRSPNFLRPLSMSLRTGFGLVIPVTTLAIFFTFRIPGRIGEFIAMTVTLGLFAMPLAGLWAAGETQTTVLNGIIPMADAADYYMDALRLLSGDKFSIFSARRPLFSGLLATTLLLTDRNLMTALAVLTGITAFACYFTVKEIQRTHGAVTASFILMILFLFYRAHSGISMSENLGVALGALGFGFLWRGAANKDLTYIWIGLFTTTLALNARAGAFFILPMLILWAGRIFRQNSLLSWKAVMITTSAVIVAFGLNFSFTRVIAVPSGVPFANFSYTLYGLASGGNSWIYVFESHPELLAIPEPGQTLQIYKLAFDLIRANPLLLIKGALFNWSMLFSNSWYNVYAYVGGENWTVNVAASWLMYALALTGLFAWYKDRQNPVNSLIAAAIFGVFISVPFLPPTDTYRMRSYAASIIVLAALPALGLDFILRKSKIKFLEASYNEVTGIPSLPVAFNFILIAMTVIAPVFILWNAKPVTLNASACSSTDSEAVLIRFDEGTYINLKKQNQPFLDWMPDYHIGLFRKNLHSMPMETMNWATTLEPPVTLFLALTHPDQRQVWIILKTDTPPTPGKYYQACGKEESESAYLVGSKTLFYADEMLPITP